MQRDEYEVIAKIYNTKTYPGWGYENRTVAVRVPAGNPRARRIEHRVAGADANPYLALAVILAAMLDGIERSINPGPVTTGNGYDTEEPQLPTDMQAALRLFGASSFISSALGPEMQRVFGLTKAKELAEFQRRITALEYHAYLERL